MSSVRRATQGLVWGTLLFAAGCVTLPWVPTGGVYTSETHPYTVELPQGWMRWTQDKDDDLIVTRDGDLLQYILIERVSTETPLKHTKKRLAKGMLPQEAAEVVLDNFSSDKNHSGFEVKENRPIRIGGFPGFRVAFTYKTADSLKVTSVYCGFLTGEWLYGLRYTAPQRHYFDKDLRTFERVLQSFRMTKRT